MFLAFVSWKYVDLCGLLSPNLAYTEPETQLLYDGHMILSTSLKKTKRRIEDTLD